MMKWLEGDHFSLFENLFSAAPVGQSALDFLFFVIYAFFGHFFGQAHFDGLVDDKD